MCSTHRDSFQWHHICSLDDWLQLEVEPCLANGNGTALPVAWKQRQGDQIPLTLEAAALIYGYNITFQQACGLIRHLGGTVPPAPVSKATVMQILINMTVPENYVEAAKAASLPKPTEAKADDFDSDLSEVLSELAHDDNNHQDLKDLKAKKRTYKLRKKLAEKDDPVEGKKRRAKAKAKGKAKAKAKGRPKAKASLSASLWKRAQQKLDEEREQTGPEEHHLDLDVMEKRDGAEPEEAPRAAEPEEAPPAPPPPEAPPAPPPPEPSLPAELAAEEAVAEVPEPASSSKAPPVKRPRVAAAQRSPDDILLPISPPGCRFGMSYQDHRWTSVWKYDHSELPAPYSQKYFSRTFAAKQTWQDAIREVHSHNWKKWLLVKNQYPLEPDKHEQVPGQVPQAILAQLKQTVDDLGPVVRYGRK